MSSQTDMDHVITNVFQRDNTSPLAMSMSKEQINDIYDLLSLSTDNINNLLYDRGDKKNSGRRLDNSRLQSAKTVWYYSRWKVINS